MTPAQKAAQTARERRAHRNAEAAELRRDREQAIAICRKIRDDDNAADADRLEAIRLLNLYNA
jgi:hypothetical protein